MGDSNMVEATPECELGRCMPATAATGGVGEGSGMGDSNTLEATPHCELGHCILDTAATGGVGEGSGMGDSNTLEATPHCELGHCILDTAAIGGVGEGSGMGDSNETMPVANCIFSTGCATAAPNVIGEFALRWCASTKLAFLNSDGRSGNPSPRASGKEKTKLLRGKLRMAALDSIENTLNARMITDKLSLISY
ncbi:MAG: hypothetical protein ACJ746_32000 [Bryobacteraceae bacterium]